MIYSKTTIILL